MDKSTEGKFLCFGCNKYKLIRNMKRHLVMAKKCCLVYSKSEENQNELQRICDSYAKNNSINVISSDTSQPIEIQCKGCGFQFKIGTVKI